MTKDAHKKSLLLHFRPRVALGALAGLGFLPGTASAQAVIDVTQALDTPTEPPTPVDFASEEQFDPSVEVKTREVSWDVPWIEPEPIAAYAEPYEDAYTAPVDNNQLAMAFEEEAAIAQSVSHDYPLIAVGSATVTEAQAEPELAEPVVEASPDLISFGIKEEGKEAFTFAEPDDVLIAVEPDADIEFLEADALEAETLEAEVLKTEVLETEILEADVQSDVPLTLAADEDTAEPQALFQADAPLLALATTEEKQSFNTVAPLIAVVDTAETPVAPKKAPWLASSLPSDEAAPIEAVDSIVPQLALLTEEEEEDEFASENAPWIALANDGDDDEQKAPWLARSLSSNTESQAQENPSAPRLAIALPRRDANKRPSDWISLTPVELIAPDGDAIAIAEPTANRDAQAYDVSGLQQVAITPADLSETGELAVSVEASEVEFLSPEAGAFLDIPATSVVLRFPVGANIALLTNGLLVDSSLVGRTETDAETQLRTQSWYGVPLVSGENVLDVISTETGDVLQSLPLTVRGMPERLVLLSPSAIPSDGRSTASVRGQLVDGVGNISRWDSVATLQASDGQFLGADHNPDLPGFQVEIQRGEFVAELQSSLESHLVQLQASANGFDAFGQIQFNTPQRPNLISGVIDVRLGARGTDFYDSYREFLPVEGDNDYAFDVDAAVFATGNLGEWLYTGAYNSDRTLNENCRGESALFRASDSSCTNVYPTYGDDSYSDVVAPSLDSVYLRLERNSPTTDSGIDYAMWGDYNTEEFATSAQLFTATNRQLHGFKANYNFGNLALTGLYANNVEGFQRDTIAPDGTSGFYFTSQRDLIPGSEDVYLELEELERPGTVLERRQLARGADYEIDYDRGTLLFNDPITRTAVDGFGQLLVRRIVTTYQHEDGNDTDIFAGRAQYTLNRTQGQESWIGASYFTEDRGTRDFSLYGADTQIALGENAQIVAEIAESSSGFDTAGEVGGTAYRIEAEATLGNLLSAQAFYRSTDAGFTNSATTSFVPGQTRYGTQLTSRIGKTTSLRARFDHEDNFGTAPRVVTDLSSLLSGANNQPGAPLDNSLTTYSLGVSQRIGQGTAEVDWIHRDRSDRLNSDTNRSSDQLRSRFTTPIFDKLTLVAQNELNLSSNVDPIYPSRTLIGLNWEAMPWLNVGVNQIFYGGGGNRRGNATSIDVTGEHTFASDTTVRGRFSTVDGRQIGGTIGLEQGINLAPGLDLDLGYEKVFSTFGNETAASTQFSQPYANGAAALGLAGGESYSIGLSYTDNPDFQASTRFEHRSSSTGSNTVFDLSALGRLTPELTVLGDYRLASTANQNITGLGTTSLLKLGLAYRNPKDDRFNALLRYEHRMNPNSVPSNALGASTEAQEHLFSAEAIYAPNWRWELYGKYALRNSRTDINGAGNSFSNSNTVQLAQARATYRLGYRWDVVGEARWLGGNGYSETGYSVEAGYYPLPDLRVSAGYSGGAADYDFGENRDAGGFYIGATAKLSGLLNGFGTQPSAPYQQSESVIEVSQDTTNSLSEAASRDLLDNSQGEEIQSPSTYPSATEL